MLPKENFVDGVQFGNFINNLRVWKLWAIRRISSRAQVYVEFNRPNINLWHKANSLPLLSIRVNILWLNDFSSMWVCEWIERGTMRSWWNSPCRNVFRIVRLWLYIDREKKQIDTSLLCWNYDFLKYVREFIIYEGGIIH